MKVKENDYKGKKYHSFHHRFMTYNERGIGKRNPYEAI
jgi:hypothetical protein